MKAIKDGKVVELGESGFKSLQSKGWKRVEEIVDDAPEGEDEDYKDEDKEPEKELELIPDGDEIQLPPADDEEKEGELPSEGEEELVIPERVGTAHDVLIEEVKANKGKRK